MSYDALVVGTGAVPLVPPIRGLTGPDALGPDDGVHLLHTMGQTFALATDITHGQPATALIVGAGYIGVEMAHHRQLGVTYLPLGTTAHKQGRVAGANAVGGNARFTGSLGTQVVKVFDLYATALFHDMTVAQLADLDLSYTPPLGSPWDAVQMAAQQWESRVTTTNEAAMR